MDTSLIGLLALWLQVARSMHLLRVLLPSFQEQLCGHMCLLMSWGPCQASWLVRGPPECPQQGLGDSPVGKSMERMWYRLGIESLE
jgi:hypothetical protein